MLLQKKKHLLALFTIFKTSSLAYGSFKEGDIDLLTKQSKMEVGVVKMELCLFFLSFGK